jgi:hypothetical protein
LVGNVARIAENRNVYMVWWRNLKESGYLEELGVEWLIILKQILEEIRVRGLD